MKSDEAETAREQVKGGAKALAPLPAVQERPSTRKDRAAKSEKKRGGMVEVSRLADNCPPIQFGRTGADEGPGPDQK